MFEEKLKDKTKMETEIMEKIQTNMIAAMEEQQERLIKNLLQYQSRSRSSSRGKRDTGDNKEMLSEDSDIDMEDNDLPTTRKLKRVQSRLATEQQRSSTSDKK